jgi:hypothetical protein
MGLAALSFFAESAVRGYARKIGGFYPPFTAG